MEGSPGPARRGVSFWLSAVVILLVLAGVILTVFFGVRVLRGARELRRARLHPIATDVSLIRPWMTLPYLARAYRVPEDALWQGLGLSPVNNRHKSLRVLNNEYAPAQPGALLEKVRAVIRAYQVQHPPTPTADPPEWPDGEDGA